jgi:hypothetical protein
VDLLVHTDVREERNARTFRGEAEDESSKFLRKVCIMQQVHTAVQSRKQTNSLSTKNAELFSLDSELNHNFFSFLKHILESKQLVI